MRDAAGQNTKALQLLRLSHPVLEFTTLQLRSTTVRDVAAKTDDSSPATPFNNPRVHLHWLQSPTRPDIIHFEAANLSCGGAISHGSRISLPVVQRCPFRDFAAAN